MSFCQNGGRLLAENSSSCPTYASGGPPVASSIAGPGAPHFRIATQRRYGTCLSRWIYHRHHLFADRSTSIDKVAHLIMRILIGVLLLFAAACTFGQTLPIKEGLWENVVYNDDGTPSFRSHDCLTQKTFAEMMTKVNAHPGCKLTNQNYSSRGLTVDMSCNLKNVQMTTHGVIEVLDSEHVRGTQTIKMVIQGHPNDSTTKSAGHFLSSSCGKIKPGAPEILDK